MGSKLAVAGATEAKWEVGGGRRHHRNLFRGARGCVIRIFRLGPGHCGCHWMCRRDARVGWALRRERTKCGHWEERSAVGTIGVADGNRH